MEDHGLKSADWNGLKAFAAVMETGSITAAAQALGVSQPTLSRQISALEVSLGCVLFERVGRGIVATPIAHKLLPHVQRMVDAAVDLSFLASGSVSEIAGEVTITCSEVDALYAMPRILQALGAQYPSININLIASNDSSDLLRREADIAIRGYRPTEPELVARKVADFQADLYATPTYLDQIGRPKTLADLKSAEFIGFYDAANNQEYIEALNHLGVPVSRENFSICCNSHLGLWELCRQGMGIGVMAKVVGDVDKKVQPVLPKPLGFIGERWLVSHRELRTNLRMRTVYDFLFAALRESV